MQAVSGLNVTVHLQPSIEAHPVFTFLLGTGVLVLLQSEEYKQPQWHRVTGKFTSYYSPVYTDKIESV